MTDFEQTLNDVIDDNVENLFGDSSKTMAKMVEQGTKTALNEVSLSKDFDSIDVAKKSKGSVTTLTFAVSGDSAEINCAGFNSILLQVVGSVTVSVKGSMISGGTVYACQNGATAMSQAITTGGCVFYTGIPDYIKINSNGAATVYVQPLNV